MKALTKLDVIMPDERLLFRLCLSEALVCSAKQQAQEALAAEQHCLQEAGNDRRALCSVCIQAFPIHQQNMWPSSRSSGSSPLDTSCLTAAIVQRTCCVMFSSWHHVCLQTCPLSMLTCLQQAVMRPARQVWQQVKQHTTAAGLPHDRPTVA